MKMVIIIVLLLNPIMVLADISPDERVLNSNSALKFIKSVENPSKQQITDLLLAEKYVELEDICRDYEAKFRENSLYESSLIKLFNAIDKTNLQLKPSLDKWINMRPSYISYTARGVYLTNQATYERGDKIISETPRSNIEKMRALFVMARRDLMTALNENPLFPPTYHSLLRIHKFSGNHLEKKRVFERAIENIPDSYYIRYLYLDSLAPRWGGSLAQMEHFVLQLDSVVDLNPRLWALKGLPATERGKIALAEKNYDDSIKYYTEALQFGDRLGVLERRSYAYIRIKDYRSALADFKKYLEYDPSNSNMLYNVESFTSYLNNMDKEASEEK